MPSITLRRPRRTTRTTRPVVKTVAAGLLLAMPLSACATGGSPEPAPPEKAALSATTPAAQRVVAGRALEVRPPRP